MTSFTTNQDRHVIPRWRTLEETARMGELNPSTHHKPTPWPPPQHHDPIARIKNTWERHPTIFSASDFIGAAVFWNRPHEALDAIEFLDRRSEITEPLRESIELALPDYFNTPPPPTPPALSIKKKAELRVNELREKLHISPQRPFTQVDIALAHTILGHNDKAKQHITIAQQLAPNDRHVLRSAARFWLHINDNDQAHDILTRSDRTRHDPWLMAAEIAIGNYIGTKPIFAKRARAIISDQSLQKSHISELASASATLDWNHGAIIKAKKLFEQSLEDPTENSFAQAVWISFHDDSFAPGGLRWRLLNAYEASAHNHYMKGNWKQAAEQCRKWQQDQPFSPAPAVDGSFIASFALNDFHLAIQFAKHGLIANPDEFMLLNNLAVAFINLGKYKKAQEHLSKINLAKTDTTLHDLATFSKIITTGLLHYRTGNIEQGRQHYQTARTLARTVVHPSSDLVARATAIHAIEEFPHQTNNYNQLLNEALHLLAKHNNSVCDRLRQKLLNLKTPPPN